MRNEKNTASSKLAEITVEPEWIPNKYRSLAQEMNEEGISTCEDSYYNE